MWWSHLIGRKVTGWSNTMRMTSLAHYSSIISPINTGGLCTSSTKPSQGSGLPASGTNHTLKGRRHTEHREGLPAKLSLCWGQSGVPIQLRERGKEGKRTHSTETARSRFDSTSPWPFLSNTGGASWERPGQEGRQKREPSPRGPQC